MVMVKRTPDDEFPQRREKAALANSSHRAEVALHGIYEISKILSMPGRLEVSLSNTLTILSSFLEMRHGLIALLNEDGEPEVVVGMGWSEGNAKRHFDQLPERAIGQIVATKMPIVVEDVASNPLFTGSPAFQDTKPGSRVSFIGVPIKERDRVVGTLTIDRVWDGHSLFRFDEDVRFLVMIANLVGQTIRLYDIVVRDRERMMEEQRRIEKELERASSQVDGAQNVSGIVGASQAIRSVFEKIKVVARTHTTVLLRGESGTGKELFARAIHDLSPRKKQPFVKLNCAALPESMLETELFGHEKGSFTGAIAQRKGRFELADKGTLFLDEIGEISPSFQAKLLRVLQEGEFERVGGMRTIKVDVRLVCATNKNLEDAVSRGDFRADLYYRINVVTLILPPLRERPEDVVLLANEFLQRFNKEHETEHVLTGPARRVLEQCYFPGNVRELENCVRRTATLAKGVNIVADDFACRNDTCLSSMLWKGLLPSSEPARKPVNRTPPPVEPARGKPPPVNPEPMNAEPKHPIDEKSVAHGDETSGLASPSTDEEASRREAKKSGSSDLPLNAGSERERIVEAMERAGWVQAKAARLLNLTPRQIAYALNKYDIPIKKF